METRQPAKERGCESYFVERDGIRFSGVHLLIDMWGGGVGDAEVVERVLRETVRACGVTLLRLELHRFDPNDGITGVATLSESPAATVSAPCSEAPGTSSG